ncbi:hypothetical protein DYB32_009929 [Aphanomyces invadans]|uniref:DDE-1 domain-containing protein n=1 Tax=Aphanomyces invadans TaxID=157072 RepID=A0A418AGV9_9STRA|nr:hypothetical protein DYB32_009929 [Aphanomyces invadans]
MADGRDNSKLLSYEAFEGGRKEPKDYHAMFNHAYFVGWFQLLLDDVAALQECNAIIVLDNAKYHKGLLDDTPSGSWAKDFDSPTTAQKRIAMICRAILAWGRVSAEEVRRSITKAIPMPGPPTDDRI